MSDIEVLERIAISVSKLPFGSSSALPWCRESFPELDAVMREWEAIVQEKKNRER
jgi:hypothetical protein